MGLKRTQVYLEPEQHQSLKREARERGISLAELLRQIVGHYLRRERPKEEFLRIVGLGKSGRNDISEDHDRYLTETIATDEDPC